MPPSARPYEKREVTESELNFGVPEIDSDPACVTCP